MPLGCAQPPPRELARLREAREDLVAVRRVRRLVVRRVERRLVVVEEDLGLISNHSMAIVSSDAGAVFSSCRRWRYPLCRRWDPAGPVANFLMLNPSTADECDSNPRSPARATM